MNYSEPLINISGTDLDGNKTEEDYRSLDEGTPYTYIKYTSEPYFSITESKDEDSK
ncbi:MAG: hypothetical protein GY754_00790 [bacterium]|nr:hypothetical protein [bacterium]